MRRGEFVTISTHLFPHDATLAVLKARLDLEGIPYFMQDDHYVAIAPFESLAIGGVKLRTLARFEDRVKELMAEMAQQLPIPEEAVDPEDAAWVAERLHKSRQVQAKMNRWVPIIGGTILVLTLLGLLFQDLFRPAKVIRARSYSTQTLP